MDDQHSAAAQSILNKKAALDAEREAAKTPEQLTVEERKRLREDQARVFQDALMHVQAHLPGITMNATGRGTTAEGQVSHSIVVSDYPDLQMVIDWSSGPYVLHIYDHGREDPASRFNRQIEWPLSSADDLINPLLEAFDFIYGQG
jgi:hypothetical protein